MATLHGPHRPSVATQGGRADRSSGQTTLPPAWSHLGGVVRPRLSRGSGYVRVRAPQGGGAVRQVYGSSGGREPDRPSPGRGGGRGNGEGRSARSHPPLPLH